MCCFIVFDVLLVDPVRQFGHVLPSTGSVVLLMSALGNEGRRT